MSRLISVVKETSLFLALELESLGLASAVPSAHFYHLSPTRNTEDPFTKLRALAGGVGALSTAQTNQPVGRYTGHMNKSMEKISLSTWKGGGQLGEGLGQMPSH